MLLTLVYFGTFKDVGSGLARSRKLSSSSSLYPERGVSAGGRAGTALSTEGVIKEATGEQKSRTLSGECKKFGPESCRANPAPRSIIYVDDIAS